MCWSPPIDDNEVPAANPASMRDRGQSAMLDIVIRSFDSLCKETYAIGDSREGPKIRTPAVKRYLVGEFITSEGGTVIGCDRGERCRPAVVARTLAN